MVDPNRKINLPSEGEEDEEEEATSNSDSDLNEGQIELVKEFEEEFRNRFTENDEIFMDFCKQTSKPPPVVFPFDCGFRRHNNHHNFRGGRGGGGNSYHRGRGNQRPYYHHNQDRRNQNYHNDRHHPYNRRPQN